MAESRGQVERRGSHTRAPTAVSVVLVLSVTAYSVVFSLSARSARVYR
jgi:hypothetical protein